MQLSVSMCVIGLLICNQNDKLHVILTILFLQCTPLLAGLMNTGSYVPPLSLELEPVPDLNIPFLKIYMLQQPAVLAQVSPSS